jgi:superfamily II DNA or RNA helicase
MSLALENKFRDIIKKMYKLIKRLPSLDVILYMNPDLYLEDEKYIEKTYKPLYNKIILEYKKTPKKILDVKPLKLRKYQKEYVNEALEELNTNSRCLLDAPTGSGKTKMAFVIQSSLIKENKRMIYVFVSPLLRINKQCLKDSYLYYNTKFNTSGNLNLFEEIEVNSANKGYKEKLENLLTKTNNNLLLSTTYQSIKYIFDLSLELLFEIDLLILDEAHCIPSYVHSNKYFENLDLETDYNISSDEKDEIKQTKTKLKKKEWYNIFFSNNVKQRLFLTATPYDYQIKGTEKYGKHINKIKLGELIESNTLSEIKTYVASVQDKVNVDKSNYDRPDTAASIITFIKRTNRYRLCIFVNNCKNANNLKECILNCSLYKSFKYDTGLEIKEPILYLSGENTQIKDFSNNETPDNFNNNEVRIIISCKKLSMGVDIPCIDSIVFADPRMVSADISQCIGRGLRHFKYGDRLKECCILLIKYINDETDKRNKMIFEYLDYLNKNNVFTLYKDILEYNKLVVTTNIIESEKKINLDKENNLEELNIYKGDIYLDIEYYKEYSKFRYDINSKKSMNLNNFIKLLEEHNIKHPEKDIDKYKLLQQEYELPNINNIRSKYPEFGWILCNKEHKYYSSLEECEIKLKENKSLLIKKIGDDYEYMDNLEIYNECIKLDTKIPEIYYTDFYVPNIYNKIKNENKEEKLIKNDKSSENIIVNLNNYKKHNFVNYKLNKCCLEYKNLETNLISLINNIYNLLKKRNEDFKDYEYRFTHIKNNYNINDCVKLILEVIKLYDLNLYLEFIFENKKIKIENYV